ncbi:hypothetical protein PR048_025730 [Dryococelus australis]|uniref:Uncharacterized protein n=1 Tax=Dryococelus australis TaxID=614101 RepID=A0ABQ9GJC4_9NEOP|nr:hypothetical protein PR048_025730 [Dryococelus australis]
MKTQEQTWQAMRRSCLDIIFVVQAKDDAGILIVTTALDIELSGNPAILVGINTDLLEQINGNVKTLHPSMNKTYVKLYDIDAIQKNIGDMQNAFLFAHAATGSDKTSAIYGKGKIKAYKLFQKSVNLRSKVVNIFNSPTSHPEEVASTGERCVQALYPGGVKFNNIDDLQLHLYICTVARQALTAS